MNDELTAWTALDIASRVRARDVSPVEVTRRFLEAIEADDPRVSAYCTVAAEAALDDARRLEAAIVRGEDVGPLAGVPVSVKDTLPVAGFRTTGACIAFAEHVAATDATAVARLRAAGCVVVGKTVCSELGVYGETTHNLLFPEARNPWDPERTPGGSSGGAAAAVAAGLGPIALATDEGGSIRLPAHFCGVVGFKASYGRVPRGPVWLPGLSHSSGLVQHIGPLARTVTDVALALDAMAGPHAADPASDLPSSSPFLEACRRPPRRMRIGLTLDLGYARLDPDVAERMHAGARAFEQLGHDVIPLGVSLPDPSEAAETLSRARYAEALRALSPHARLTGRLSRVVAEGARVSAGERAAAAAAVESFRQRLLALFADHDLLLLPVAAVTAFGADRHDGPATVGGAPARGLDWMPFTLPFNLAGLPALAVPCGLSSTGLPCGLQIVGSPNADARVLAAGAAYEAAYPDLARITPDR